jgi:hypothetical protein
MFLPRRQNSGKLSEGESGQGMPDRDVTTIKDLIYYQYAKTTARSAFAVPDGTTAKGNHFMKQTFREPQNKLFTNG